MKRNKKSRLLSLRIIGIILLVYSGYIIWDSNTEIGLKKFWSFKEKNSFRDIYSMTGKWFDQNGKLVNLNDFRGKTSIISFNFLKCRKLCSQLIHDLKLLDRTIKSNKDNLKFLVFLFDDVRKSPDSMKKYIKQYQINKKYWHVLTSDKKTLYDLTTELSIKYKVLDESIPSYIHSNYIGVIGSDGKIIKSFYGWQYETTKLISEILNASNKLKLKGLY